MHQLLHLGTVVVHTHYLFGHQWTRPMENQLHISIVNLLHDSIINAIPTPNNHYRAWNHTSTKHMDHHVEGMAT